MKALPSSLLVAAALLSSCASTGSASESDVSWYNPLSYHWSSALPWNWFGSSLTATEQGVGGVGSVTAMSESAAMAFTSIPFVVRTVQPVLEELGPEYEEAAQTLGATPWQSFRRVVLPEVAPALLAGTALSFTRSIGEFGAVIFIAGNIAWKTEVTSLMIFVRLQEFDYPAASAIASVILAASLVLLFAINTLQSRFGRRLGGH